MNYSNELYHYGIRGMHWGVRRYQNYDGTLTRAGNKRYNLADGKYDSGQQRKDSVTYGRTAVRRIAKSVGRGETLGSARSKEKINYDKTKRQGARNAFFAGLVGATVFRGIGKTVVESVMSSDNALASELITSPLTRAIVSIGSTFAGYALTSELAYDATMAYKGYDPFND